MKTSLRKEAGLLIRKAIFCTAILLSALALQATPVQANPAGGVVSGGAATISSSGNTVDVTQTTNKAIIDWRSFNIAAGETTNFIQPSSSAMTLNRIGGGSPSQIFGHLTANGNIEIINPSGVLFGTGSQVDVNGLVATTANISNQAFMANGPLAFNQPGDAAASVINNGTITAADAGLVGLVAPNVVNSGVITAKLGTVHLASADSFTLDLYGDGLLNFKVSDAVQKQLVSNTGTLSAAGGKIALTAAAGNKVVDSLINVSGKLSAPAVAEKNGHIYIYAEGSNAVKGNVAADKGQKSGSSTVTVNGDLDASGDGAGQTGGKIAVLGDNVDIESGAVLNANGDAGGGTVQVGGDFHGQGTTPTALTAIVDAGARITANANTTGDGGKVTVWSDDSTQFRGDITATGGAQSGNGGSVETSGHEFLDFDGSVDLLAATGSAGTLLLDPENVVITNNASVTDNCSGTCTPTGDTSYLNVSTLDAALASSNVTVTTGASGSQAGNITVDGTADAGGAVAIHWNTGNLLTLSAAANINIDSGATITNTYNVVNGTFGAGSIPVVLALRADNGSVNGASTAAGSSYGVTNNGTINMSGSSGAVSIFNDWNFTPVSGTQTQNGSWSALTYAPNYSVSNQFTTYKLVNSVNDLVAMGADTGAYALGTNITGGGAVFNGNTPLDLFMGTLDGQYCALAGGGACNISGFTLTSPIGGDVGLFFANDGIIRNLGVGLTVTDIYSGSVNQEVGALAGENDNTLANVTALSSGSVNLTTNLSGTQTDAPLVGGLVGYNAGTGVIINSSAADHVSYTYSGTTTSGTSYGEVGGLVGFNASTAPISIIGSSASGTVQDQFGASSSGGTQVMIGGLVGYNYSSSTIANSFATGNVIDALGGTGNVGGLVGFNVGTIEGTGSSYSYYHASGSGVSYTSNDSNIGVGGLVGANYGVITQSYNASDITYNGTAWLAFGGLAGANGATISNSYNTGQVIYSGDSGVGNSAYVGGLAGATTGPISNSYSTGNVRYTSGNSTAVVGGLVGENDGSVTTSYTYGGTVTVTSTASGSNLTSFDFGGLVGYNEAPLSGSYSSEKIVYNNQAAAGASASLWALEGGLVGYNGGSIQTSYATGDVTGQYSGGSSGGSNINVAGGLVGLNGLNSIGTVQTSFATGNVNVSITPGAGGVVGAGGFVGDNYSTSAVPIADSYSTGAVTMSSGASGYAGSFAGINNDGITNVYATGWVNNPAGVSGGLIASNATTIGATNYWDSQTTGQSSTSGGGTSQTTAQLQAGLPTGFSSSTWGIVAGTSYPYLLWQVPSGTPEVVSGKVYSDHGVTTIAGASVGLLANGAASLLGSTETTGANGYYYFLLAPGTIAGSGSDVVAYVASGGAGSILADGATTSLSGFNIYGNIFRIDPLSTSIAFASDFSSAVGANNSASTLGTVASNTLTVAGGDTVEIGGAGIALNLTQFASTTGNIYISGIDALTQSSGGLTAANISVSANSISLNQSNAVGTAAFSAAGNIAFNDTGNLTLGTVNGLSGIADSAAGTASVTTTGNMTVSQALNGSASHALNINLSAGGYISDTVNINTYGGNLVMRSNNADAAATSATVNAIDIQNATLQTGGGYMIFGGGSASDSNGNPTGYAYSSGLRGIYFNTDTINAGGGSINAMAESSSGSSGAYVLNSTITTSGTSSASITLQALETNNNFAPNGLALNGDTISTTAGNINLTGNAAGTGDGIFFLSGGSNIYSTSGNISLTGTGAANTTGIYFTSGFTYKIYSASGNITLNGGGAGTGSDYQFLGTQYIGTNNTGTTTTGNVIMEASGLGALSLGSATKIATSGSGKVTLYANALSAGAANAVSSAGSLTIAPYTNISMGVGTSAGGTLNLTDTTLGFLSAASYIFGSLTVGDGTASTGNMTINTGDSFSGKTASFVSGGNMAIAGSFTAGTLNLTDTGALTQSAVITATNLSASANSISLGQNNVVGTAAFSGAGNITFKDTGNLTLGTVNGLNGIADSAAGTASVTTTGNLTVSQALNGSSGNALNINLSAGGYISDTAGINTYGGNLVMRSNNADVATISGTINALDIQNATLQTGGGYMIFGGGSASDSNGNPTGYAYSSGLRGLYLNNDTVDAGGGSISAIGKNSTTASGAYVSNSTITTSGGSAAAITLQGLSIAGFGLVIDTDTISNISGNISITGTTTSGGRGLQLKNPDNIHTTSGNISLTGTGTVDSTGIYLGAGSTYKIYSTSGNITLNGSGNGTGADFLLSGTEYIGTNNTGTTTTGNVILNANSLGGITLPAAAHIAVSGAGNIILNAGSGAFTNTNGANPFTLGTGRWVIYSATPGGDTFDNLNSNNTAIWDTAYNGTVISQAGNRYVFSYQPTVTFTTTSASKNYGVNAAAAVATDYTVSGLQPAVTNAYLADTNATAFSGAPGVTSAGSAVAATIAGGPYAVTAAQGTLSGVDGYALAYVSTGLLAINKAPLVITADNESKFAGAPFTFTDDEFTVTGLAGTDTITGVTLTSNGAAKTAIAGAAYAIVASAAAGSFNPNNYIISYDPGVLTVNALPNTVVLSSQNLQGYSPEDAPAQNPNQNKPQNTGTSFQSNTVHNNQWRSLHIFGGMLHIDPALVKRFNLEYLEE